jgi:DNA-binding NtrC family response regulator
MRTHRILVVDDSPVIRDVLREFLRGRYEIDTAANASQALAAFVRRSPDLILLDIRMPGVDGLSLLRSFRDTGMQVPIFVMTGYASLEIARDALDSGATAYLPKPFDLRNLDRLIADALGTAEIQPTA